MAVTQNKHVTDSHLIRFKLAFSKLLQNCSVYFHTNSKRVANSKFLL